MRRATGRNANARGTARALFWQGLWRRGILAGMDAPEKRRWYCPTPGWLVLGSLAVTGLLFVSERGRWFPFNEHKGWTVLLAVAAVGVVLVVMLLWLLVALIFRWRFQFGIRTLLVLVVARRCRSVGWPLASRTQRRSKLLPRLLRAWVARLRVVTSMASIDSSLTDGAW